MAKPSTRSRPPEEPQASWSRLLLALLLAAITVGIYARGVGDNFLLVDDNVTIADNPNLNPPTLASVLHYWNPANATMELYVPVTYTAWGICAKLAYVDVPDEDGWNLNPYVFHAASLLVHVINVLLLFLILSRLTGHDWAAAFGAGLFALHPVQVEAVAWASGLKDLLGGTFILLVILHYLNYSDAPSASNSRASIVSLGLGGLAVVLGMLSKPNAAVAPLMAGLIGYFILRQPIRRVLVPVTFWLLLALPLLIFTSSLQEPIAGLGGTLLQRPLVMSFTLAFYLFKLVWPATLAMDYGWHTDAVLALKWIGLLALVPVALAGVMLYAWKRIPWLAASIGIFVVGILPVLGLKSFHSQYNSTVADHYLYPSMIGVSLALAFLLARFQAQQMRNIVAAVSVAALLALGVRSYFQLAYYTSNQTFFTHIAEVTPGSFLRGNYATFLFQRGLQYRIGSHEPNTDAATIRERAQHAEEYFKEARENLDGLILARPGYPRSYRTYALLLIAEHQFDAAEQMIARFIDAVHAQPAMFGGEDLAEDQIEFARAYAREKAIQPAEQHLQNALAAYTRDRRALITNVEQVRAEIQAATTQPAP